MEFVDSRDGIGYKSSQERIREFVGKVKIVLVDSPKGVYLLKRWTAAFIMLSQMFIGITNVMILFYVLSFKSKILINLHIFLCMVGFQLCIPAGMLCLNSFNGSTIPMNNADKKFEHAFLGTFGLLCCVLGTITIIVETSTEMTLHATFGLIAVCLVLLSAITGLCSSGQELFVTFIKYIHIITGALGFLTSSVCFMTGLYRPCIENWVPSTSIVTFLVIFCSVYSTVITLASLRRLCKN